MDISGRDIEEAEEDANQFERDSSSLNISRSALQARTRTLSTGSILRHRDTHPLELDRIATHKSLHSGTVGRRGTKVPTRVETLGAGKIFAPADYNVEEFLVEFDGHDDPLHPQNWPKGRRILYTVILTYNVFVTSFASSIYETGIRQVSEHFHVSAEVSLLGLSLYVFGFATGPIIWGPMSEIVGRQKPIFIGMFGFCIFTVGSAVAKDLQTLMLTRYFAGCFATALLSVVPACFADLFNNKERGVAMAAFAMGVFVGPFVAPFTGGFIVDDVSLRWRWTMYISAIMGFAGLAALVFYPETYPPAILVTKAGRLRRLTHDWRIHAKQEEVEVDFKQLVVNNLSRPMRMLVTEPIVLLVSIYMSFVYGLLYAFLGAYPLIFQGVHHMNPGVGGLPFIGLIVGQLLGGLFIMFSQKSYLKKLEANDNKPIPEWRMPPAIVGGVAFTLGLFWLGWTGWSPHIHWIAPTLSGLLTGFGILTIFLQGFNYLVDAYVMFAASVIAANTVLRSFVAGAFPLFTTQMFNNLGIQWAGTLVGCLALIMVPIPVVFYLYGAKLREKSSYAPTPAKPKDIETPDEPSEKSEDQA